VLDVDRLEADVGARVELTDVLLLSESGRAVVGTPTVADARVVAEVVEHGRDKKILVFKYKNKTRYRRRRGHRQDYTRLAIKQIGIGTMEAPRATPKRVSRKKSDPVGQSAEALGTAVEAVSVTSTESKPAKRRLRKVAGAATPVAAAVDVDAKEPAGDARAVGADETPATDAVGTSEVAGTDAASSGDAEVKE
jgi:large subunit ribosomal protein L21